MNYNILIKWNQNVTQGWHGFELIENNLFWSFRVIIFKRPICFHFPVKPLNDLKKRFAIKSYNTLLYFGVFFSEFERSSPHVFVPLLQFSVSGQTRFLILQISTSNWYCHNHILIIVWIKTNATAIILPILYLLVVLGWYRYIIMYNIF